MVLAWLLPFAHYLFWSILQVRFDTVLPMSRVLNHRKKKSVIRKKKKKTLGKIKRLLVETTVEMQKPRRNRHEGDMLGSERTKSKALLSL